MESCSLCIKAPIEILLHRIAHRTMRNMIRKTDIFRAATEGAGRPDAAVRQSGYLRQRISHCPPKTSKISQNNLRTPSTYTRHKNLKLHDKNQNNFNVLSTNWVFTPSPDSRLQEYLQVPKGTENSYLRIFDVPRYLCVVFGVCWYYQRIFLFRPVRLVVSEAKLVGKVQFRENRARSWRASV